MPDASDCFRHVLYKHCTARPLVGMPHTPIPTMHVSPYRIWRMLLLSVLLLAFLTCTYFLILVPRDWRSYGKISHFVFSLLRFRPNCIVYSVLQVHSISAISPMSADTTFPPSKVSSGVSYIHPNKLQSHARQPGLDSPQKRMIRQTLPKARLKIPQINP
jgi:hypothetical protein